MKLTSYLTVLFLLAAVLLSACGTGAAETASFRQITAEDAKALMDLESSCVILDARTQSEYDEGHVPGAVLLPHDQVAARAEELLPDKDQLILVYCRSGNRSKQAAQALAELGYTNVAEFGGITSWPYEIEK